MTGHKTHKFTKAGLKLFNDEYLSLEKKRKLAVEELTWARDLGDRSENAAYKSARRKLSGIDSRMRFLRRVIDNSKVYDAVRTDFVNIGCRVVVKNGLTQVEYLIVGDHEADPIRSKISYRSPIGQALIGKKIGDQVNVEVPSGELLLVVMEICVG